jgi:hypothetical protein
MVWKQGPRIFRIIGVEDGDDNEGDDDTDSNIM